MKTNNITKYIFFTFTIEGVSGSPSYVNNKVKWLKENNISSIVFDHYGSLNLKGEVVLDYLLPYRKNRMIELFFPPSYFTRRQRTRIIERLLIAAGDAEDFVVESNSPRLALWGELLAERLGAKHLILNVGEQLSIHNNEEFGFLDFKLNRHELFTIKPQTIQNMFKDYRNISDEEAQNYFFAASMGVKAEEVPMPELDDLPEAKYKILSFGRYKPYFDNMIKGVVEFSEKHSMDSVNFLIMGDVVLPPQTEKMLESAPNLFVKFIPSKRPVPRAVFDYSDVVIATAGCANLSYITGTKTISMDVNTCLPLGVMGYTTIDSVYSSNKEQPNYDVSRLLEDVFIRRLFDGEQRMIKKGSGKGFDFQWNLINNDRLYWQDVDKIVMDKGLRRLGEVFVLRCGGVRLFANKKV